VNNLGRMLLVAVLCGLALAYLYQHNCSLRLTRRLVRLEKERQLLVEARDSLGVEVVRLSGFARLDSLWASEGRPANRVPASAGGTGGQVAVTGPHAGGN
jgi:hypothetical protein